MEKLTKEQLENWRKVLVGQFGGFALLMTDAQVQQYKDKMQSRIEADRPKT